VLDGVQSDHLVAWSTRHVVLGERIRHLEAAGVSAAAVDTRHTRQVQLEGGATTAWYAATRVAEQARQQATVRGGASGSCTKTATHQSHQLGFLIGSIILAFLAI